MTAQITSRANAPRAVPRTSAAHPRLVDDRLHLIVLRGIQRRLRDLIEVEAMLIEASRAAEIANKKCTASSPKRVSGPGTGESCSSSKTGSWGPYG